MTNPAPQRVHVEHHEGCAAATTAATANLAALDQLDRNVIRDPRLVGPLRTQRVDYVGAGDVHVEGRAVGAGELWGSHGKDPTSG
jgi:hypothetical protein